MRAKSAYIQGIVYLVIVLGALTFLAFSWTTPGDHPPPPLKDKSEERATESDAPEEAEIPVVEEATPDAAPPENEDS